MKDCKVTIRLEDAVKDKLHIISTNKDVPMSQIIREAIRAYIEKEGN